MFWGVGRLLARHSVLALAMSSGKPAPYTAAHNLGSCPTAVCVLVQMQVVGVPGQCTLQGPAVAVKHWHKQDGTPLRCDLACLGSSDGAGEAGVQLHAAIAPEHRLLLAAGPLTVTVALRK